LNEVARIISKEIAQRGPISFARFMELALYCPIYGYYEKEKDSIGKRGDFFTSVSVGSLFGELLGWQFAEWLMEIEPADRSPSHPYIVEAGAHNGMLAKDILSWLRAQRPSLFEQLQYIIIEPSKRRRGWQQRTLQDLRAKVMWETDLKALQQSQTTQEQDSVVGLTGIIFSNEFLDAFPVHRYGWDARKQMWFEWGVVSGGVDFAWTRLDLRANEQDPIQASFLETLSEPGPISNLLAQLPDGFSFEISQAAKSWWREAANVLGRGKLLTFDYGTLAGETIIAGSSDGTLRAYCKHQISSNILDNPGAQDLTANVHFTAFKAVGETAGLRTEAMATQEKFLTQLAAKASANDPVLFSLITKGARQLQTLVHPEHLGRFRVLLQSRA
jgi:SAM-dependent MidA family methyltransferase